jgi:hypothetical protein
LDVIGEEQKWYDDHGSDPQQPTTTAQHARFCADLALVATASLDFHGALIG